MGSKGRMPPSHVRRPLPGPAIMHPDHFGPGVQPPPPLGAFPPYDMLPPPEVMERKLAVQHVEMQKLATENQRLASTHGTLRQELAAAQHELHMLHAHIGAIKSEREQQMRGLLDKIAKMEVELKAAEPVRSELQQAHAEAENLVAARQELVSKVQQLNQDLHKAHVDAQQIPALMSELESLRQEYRRCRVSFEHEKKLFNDHLESLQVMEKNYVTMTREVEKLRSELTNAAGADMRAGGLYRGASGSNENEASAHPARQNMYEEGYGVPQRQGHANLPANSLTNGVNTSATANVGAGTGTPTYIGTQAGSAPRPGYDPSRGPVYDPSRGLGYDVLRGSVYDSQMGHSYNTQVGPGYDMQRGPLYDAQRVPGYDVQRQPTYDSQRGPAYDVQRGFSYDASGAASYNAASRGAGISHGQVPPVTNMPYGSATPPGRVGTGYEAPPQGGNPVRK